MNSSDEHKAAWLSQIESVLRGLKGEPCGGERNARDSGPPSDEGRGRSRQGSTSYAGRGSGD